MLSVIALMFGSFFVYYFVLNHYNDKALFKALGIKYDASAIEYKYAAGDAHAITFIKVSPSQLEQAKGNFTNVFLACDIQGAYCTKDWISTQKLTPHLRSPGRNVDLEVMHKATFTSDTVCRYRVGFYPTSVTTDGELIESMERDGKYDIRADDTLCINPTTGYAVYEWVKT